MFSDRPDRAYAFEVRLKQEGYRLTAADSPESLIAICNQQHPNILILKSFSQPRDLIMTLKHLMSKGVSPNQISTLLLVKGNLINFLIRLLDIGIKEIVDMDSGVETLLHKIRKVRGNTVVQSEPARQFAPPPAKKQSGSNGNLSDFSIIDLLQALGPSQRTTRITVKPEDPSSDSLLMYLSRGQITYAKLGDLLAEKAIYKALTWETGTWTSEAVTEKDLPEPNNTLPNEFILMEGCRLIDENGRQTMEETTVSA
jgi:DNA-binding NarL/FixJ family response regulator